MPRSNAENPSISRAVQPNTRPEALRTTTTPDITLPRRTVGGVRKKFIAVGLAVATVGGALGLAAAGGMLRMPSSDSGYPSASPSGEPATPTPSGEPATPTPSKSAGASPSPSGSGPDGSPPPTPVIETPAPPTATPKATPTEVAPTPEDVTQQALDAWNKKIDGKFVVDPYPKRFTNLGGNDLSILGLLEGSGTPDLYAQPTVLTLQGELIAQEIVMDSNGVRNLIQYYGFEDWGPTNDNAGLFQDLNTRFYFPFNFGPVDNHDRIWMNWKTKDNNSLDGIPKRNYVTTAELEQLGQEHIGEVLAIPVYPWKIDPNPSQKPYNTPAWRQLLNGQLPVERDLLNLLKKLNATDPLQRVNITDAEISDLLEPVMNTRITSANFSPEGVPGALGFAYK